MLLLVLKETILKVTRRIDTIIIHVTRVQKYYPLPLDGADQDRYDSQLQDVNLIQVEIEAGPSNYKLAWTLR